jgi:hypothetical protein
MNSEVKELLEQQMKSQFEKLNELDVTSDEARAVTTDVVKLYNVDLEHAKAEAEDAEKALRRENDLEIKERELKIKEDELNLKKSELEKDRETKDRELKIKEDELNLKKSELEKDRETKDRELELKEAELKECKKRKWIEITIGALSVGLPLIAYNCWFNKGMKFEETGTFTSSTFKDVKHSWNPFKKM